MIPIERKSHLELAQSKIYDLESLLRIRANKKFASQKVVFTNGCFDILHRGHAELLSKAADKGDFFIIGLSTDAAVKNQKGEGRPIQNQETRALLLASLQYVGAVILYDEETPNELIKALLPDILVKSNEYTIDQIPGSDIVLASGGEVVTIELTESLTTSCIVNKLSKK